MNIEETTEMIMLFVEMYKGGKISKHFLFTQIIKILSHE